MKIEIITNRKPFIDGQAANMGDVIEVDEKHGKAMIAHGFALEIKTEEPKRARTAKGKLKADNPSTPNVNEAWEGGKAPKKKAKK